ncbi:MFS transporter [Brevibacterium jeotgali]|uniref:Predicted arabinose efflux permease, MFS family n=1 Tax=Brevibacterium jeotgali TaxID=1262550 RepID=A0A2H1L4Y8_9MICO|nr:MFS transporter [Brevibacterium jeotgali]TWB98604.1 putative MFS family arabinose efflux permease [Brevibacterium jeotgali]SMY11795.1 Predicted arabinose efflux permease, MFS family [Brevibacterium jeotgali]
MSGSGRRWLWLLVGSAILTQTTLNLVRPTVSYQLLGMGADAGVVGAVTSAYALLPLVLVLWLGRLTERTPRLSVLVAVAAVVFSASCLLLSIATTIWVVALATVVLGVAHIVFTIAGQAAIARYLPSEELDRGFGWFTAGFAVGQLIGPVLGGLMLGADAGPGDRTAAIGLIMLVGAAVSLAAVPVIAPLLLGRALPGSSAGAPGAEDPQPRPPQSSADAGPDAAAASAAAPTMRGILRVRSVPSHMVASLALLAMVDLLIAFLPVVGEQQDVSPVWVGVFLAVRAGATILSRIVLPWLSARFRRSDLVIVSLLGAGVMIVATPSTLMWPTVTIVLMAIGGFFLGLGQPLTMTLIVQAVPMTWRSTALAVRLMGNRLGQVALPMAAGAVASTVGPAGAIWFAGLLLVISGGEKSLRRRRRTT